MSVKIRLRRIGAKKHPFYRLVVADSRSPRDGKFIEILGTYDPMTEPVKLNLDQDKIKVWLQKGARPTKPPKPAAAPAAAAAQAEESAPEPAVAAATEEA